MFGLGKKEMGIVGAAALAACSPEAEQVPTEIAPSEFIDVAEPVAGTPEGEALARQEAIESGQYTAEQVDEILSGTTEEVDSMTQEQLDELGGPEHPM